jgi:predicted nucleotidyltransferase
MFDIYCEVHMTAADLPADWPVTRYIATLRRHLYTLADRYHIESMGVFGSYVRNEQHDGSDLDVLVTSTQTPSLFTLVALQDELADLLGTPVDVVLKTSLKPRSGQQIEIGERRVGNFRPGSGFKTRMRNGSSSMSSSSGSQSSRVVGGGGGSR